MSCDLTTVDVDRCPTKDELTPQLVALLPTGRAWNKAPGTVIWKFWTAVAAVFADLEARICALRDEFWCQTIVETRPDWLTEYGLPDDCDPFPDLCAKVAAIGGSRCEYFAAVAAALGWNVTCVEQVECGGRAGGAYVGAFTPGLGRPTSIIEMDVDLGSSEAWNGVLLPQPFAGVLRAGQSLSCAPDVSSLRCVLERIIPAQCSLVLNLIAPPTYWMVSFGPTSAGDVHLIADDGALMLTE